MLTYFASQNTVHFVNLRVSRGGGKGEHGEIPDPKVSAEPTPPVPKTTIRSAAGCRSLHAGAIDHVGR